MFEEMMAENFPKSMKCKHTDTEIAANPKHVKYKENHTQAHHNEIAENQKKKMLKAASVKYTLYIAEQ